MTKPNQALMFFRGTKSRELIQSVFLNELFKRILYHQLLHTCMSFFLLHSKKCWVVLTQFWVKYGQTQPLGNIFK